MENTMERNDMEKRGMPQGSGLPMNTGDLLWALSEIEFVALDLQLYLDTHPCDQTAIELYNAAVANGEKLRKEFEACRGPLFSYISMSRPDRFSWIDDPWPWDSNFAEDK